jgi:hypothetical protein
VSYLLTGTLNQPAQDWEARRSTSPPIFGYEHSGGSGSGKVDRDEEEPEDEEEDANRVVAIRSHRVKRDGIYFKVEYTNGEHLMQHWTDLCDWEEGEGETEADWCVVDHLLDYLATHADARNVLDAIAKEAHGRGISAPRAMSKRRRVDNPTEEEDDTGRKRPRVAS